MEEPIVTTSEIQGNIFPGFSKPCQYFLGFKILDNGPVKPWLTAIAGDITTAEEVRLFRKLRALRIRQSGRSPRSEQLSTVWLNVAFSVNGLRRLAGADEVKQFKDRAFELGLHERSTFIGDPSNPANVEGSRKNWRIGGSDAKTPDIFFIIGGDDQKRVLKEADRLCGDAKALSGANGSALELIYDEAGARLPGNMGGHEHFGFKDGISQPGLRGKWSNTPQEFLCPRLIDPDDPRSKAYAAPGQPLIWPGQFIFGYKRQHGQVPTLTQPPREAPGWAHNGSFLVFRRLRQDVVLFWAFIDEQKQKLSAKPGFEAIETTALASMLVGRWPSGAPVMRTPDGDHNDLAQPPRANHFGFDQASRAVRYLAGSGIAEDADLLAPGDPDGFICPHASHIRKVNPRDLGTEQVGGSTDTLTRRILRRGIPFGPVLKDRTGNKPDPEAGNRGLLFLCYQTSISDQFEFLAEHWMNVEDRPEENPGGNDMLVGQGKARTCTVKRRINGNEFESSIQTESNWVIPTGGAYLFSPSISTIRDILGAPEPSEVERISDDQPPELLANPRGGMPDDLKRIKGVGPKLEARLHEIGVYHFDQIAAWTESNVAWLDTHLEGCKGRVKREEWVAQARILASV